MPYGTVTEKIVKDPQLASSKDYMSAAVELNTVQIYPYTHISKHSEGLQALGEVFFRSWRGDGCTLADGVLL